MRKELSRFLGKNIRINALFDKYCLVTNSGRSELKILLKDVWKGDTFIDDHLWITWSMSKFPFPKTRSKVSLYGRVIKYRKRGVSDYEIDYTIEVSSKSHMRVVDSRLKEED